MPLLIHDEALTRRVGGVVLVVTVAVVIFVVTLLDRIEGDGVRVRVYFRDVTAVAEGAPVKLAGRTVGELTSISRVSPAEAGPGHPLHGTGGIVAIARIDRDWAGRIPVNSELFINARGILAPRYLEIGPPPRGAAPERGLVAGDELRSIDPPNLDRLLQRIWTSLTDIKLFVDAVRPASRSLDASIARLTFTLGAVVPGADRWATLDRSVRDAIAEAETVIDRAGDGRIDADAVTALFDHLDALVDRIDAAITELRGRLVEFRIAIARVGHAIPADVSGPIQQAAAAAEAALATAGALVEQVRGVVEDIAAARGTIGALIIDLELFDDFKDAVKGLKRAPWQAFPPAGD